MAILLKNEYIIDFVLLKNLIFFTASIAIFFIDLKHYIIPDVISLPLIVIGVGFAFLTPEPGWKSAVLGGVVGFSLFYTIAWLYFRYKQVVGLGGGDIKYLAAVGAFVGIVGLPFVLLISSFVAIMAFLAMSILKIKRQEPHIQDVPIEQGQNILPYGPFLVLGTFLYLMLGDVLLNLYLDFIFFY